MQRFSEIDGAVLWNVNTAGRCTHTGKTGVQSAQLWEAERCLLCVCGAGGEGGRECQSCSPCCTGRMCDVCAWGGGGGGGGVGAVRQSTPTLHKNSDTLHNESLSLSLSLSLLRESRDLVLTSLVSRRILARFRFSSPFRLFKKVAVCGDCLVTLSLTINETLKWLSSLHILIKESLWWW